MMTSTVNYFGIEKPEAWRCELSSIEDDTVTIHVLYTAPSEVKVESHWLYFEDVTYIEGPKAWEGAHFAVDTSEEMLDFIHSIWYLLHPWPDKVLAQPFHAFVAQANTAASGTRTALIIAKKASMYPDSVFWNKRLP